MMPMTTLRHLALGLAMLLASPLGYSSDPLLGFGPASSEAQLELEARFAAKLDPADQDAWMQVLTEQPHHVGSEAGSEYAKWIRDQFASWGYEAEIVQYDVSIPFPTLRSVELTAPGTFTASLEEAPVAGDPSTQDPKDLLPPYHAFATAGDVEAEHGAIGALIYSDPADDGYGKGDTYPDGPFKNATGAQRGSVMDLPRRPGDIRTPYVGATEGVERIPLNEVETLTPIPVLPLSYADATPPLKALGGGRGPARLVWSAALCLSRGSGAGAGAPCSGFPLRDPAGL